MNSDEMSFELSRDQQKEYLAVARKAAAQVSRDDQVIREAADVAVTQARGELGSRLDTPSNSDGAWVGVVARNHARRLGRSSHRDRRMGEAGSEPPRAARRRGRRWWVCSSPR